MKLYLKHYLFIMLIVLSLLFTVSTVQALQVNITQDLPYLYLKFNEKNVKIKRIQDQSNKLEGGFSKTSRKCPPFCIQPFIVAPDVTTIGELELLDFIKEKIKKNTGVLIDARTASWHSKGTIPGSINIPFTTFSLKQSNRKLIKAMEIIGVRHRADPIKNIGFWGSLKIKVGMEEEANLNWDFSSAKDIILWCNGMWCGQSPRAIRGLLQLGYPAEKIYYYRGGMQAWKILGLTVIEPK